MPNLSFRKLSLIVSFFAVSLILSACSFIPGAQKEKEVTLKYWGLWEPTTITNQVIADYQKIKPNVTIIYEKKSPNQYRESLEAQIQSGKGPDIFRFHNTWTPMLKEELAPVPQDIISQSEFKKNFYPTVFFDLRNSDKQFIGVPLEIDGLALYYNEEILNAAGITQPPQTWEEFASDAIKMTVRDPAGNIKTAGAGIGSAGNVDHFSDILGLMILQNGADPKSPTDDRAADALEYYTNFAKGQNRAWDETMPSTTLAFAGGSLAMYFAPSWRAAEIKNANPLLKFKIAPVPQLPGGQVNWASYWAEGVSGKSPNQKEAWEFVKYLSQDQTLVKLYTEAAKSPGRIFGEPYPKVSMAAKLATDPLVGAYVSQASTMRSAPMASRTFDNGLNDQIIKAYEDAINSVVRGTPARAALQTTAKNVSSVISRYSQSAK